MKTTRVLIVDDQKISRQLFENFVRSSDKYELIRSIDSAKMVDIYMARYSVDLIIMDIVMGDGSNGLDACEYVKNNYPDVKLIAVTSMAEASFIERSKAIGVESFWYKEASREPLLDIMERTIAGESVYPDSAPVIKIGLTDSSDFSNAEMAVLRELTTGAENTEIAARLQISVNTVKSHIRHMLDKTGFQNRTELAIEARLKGIVVPL